MDAWNRYVERLKAAAALGTPQKKAIENGGITDMPERLAVPTLEKYQNSLTLIDSQAPHLHTLKKALADSLRLEDSVLRIDGGNAGADVLAQGHDKAPEALSKAAMTAMENPQYRNRDISIYLPDFLRMRCAKNISKDGQEAVIDKIE